MPYVYLIVSRIYGSYTRSYIFMTKQCIMFMLLLAASTADYFLPHEQQNGRHLHKDLSLDEKRMPQVYVIVSRI